MTDDCRPCRSCTPWPAVCISNPSERRQLLDWADANSSGQPFSPYAKELAMAARFYLAVNPPPENFGAVAHPDAFRAHYLDALRDESYPPQIRIALAHHLSDNGGEVVGTEVVRAAAGLAVEHLGDGEIPFTGHDLAWCLHPFCSLEPDQRWRATAEKLEGWDSRNRFFKSTTYEPAGAAIVAVLRIAAKAGNKTRVNRILTEFDEKLAEEADVLRVLVENGYGEEAAAFSDKHLLNLDYVYISKILHSAALARETPKALALIEDPGRRYMAEIYLNATPDPPLRPGRKRPEGFVPRDERLAKLAKRVGEVPFTNQSILDRCLQILSEDSAAAAAIPREVLRVRYERTDFKTVVNFENRDLIEQMMCMPAMWIAESLRLGDSAPFEKAWTDILAGSAESYFRMAALDEIVDAFVPITEEIARSSDDALTGTVLDAMEFAMETIAMDILSRDGSMFGRLVANYMVLALVAGREKRLTEWRNRLDPERSARLIGNFSPPFSVLKRVAGQSDLPADVRVKTVRAVYADEWFAAMSRDYPDIFREMREDGLLTDEELRQHAPGMIEDFARDGLAMTDYARYLAEYKEWEQALSWCDKGIAAAAAKTGPDGESREGWVKLDKADILAMAGRRAKAKQLIGEIDFNTLQIPAQVLYRRLRKRLTESD